MEFLDYEGLKFYHQQLMSKVGSSNSVAGKITLIGEDGSTVSLQVFGYYITGGGGDSSAMPVDETLETIGEFEE